jgi:GH25 family lysozyme M1 (1,4-beta-N-acetylmuramidase)
MSVRGPDVSNHQGRVDWSKVSPTDWPFAAAKATEGTDYRDPYFAGNWSGMDRGERVRIAYHFAHADPGRSGASEARFFLAHVRANGGWRHSDIPALDIEAGSLSGRDLDRFIDEFCAEVEKSWRPGLIYSGEWYLGPKGVKTAGPRRRGWKLWTSAYGPRPTIYSGFTDWLFWQYTDGSVGPPPRSVPGIGNCDVSSFNGSLAELREYAAGSLPKHSYASRKLKEGVAGTDVQRLQRYCNKRLEGHKRPERVKDDGIYGPETEQAKHLAAYVLGFPVGTVHRVGATPGVQHLIRHPGDRPKSYRDRAKDRGTE